MKHMYQQKQLEEAKRKQRYVLFSPLLSFCYMYVLYSHSMQYGVGVFSLCAEEYMTPFQCNAVFLIYTSKGIGGETGVKEIGDPGKSSSGGTAAKE